MRALTLVSRVSLVCLALSACDRPARDGVGNADLVLINGKIHTMDANPAGTEDGGGTVASGLCVTGDRITYVGTSEGAVQCTGTDTRVLDVGGRTVLPGLIDSHTHVLNGSSTVQRVNLSLADTPEKLADALYRLKADNPGDGVLYARGWQNHLFPPTGPHKSILDEVFGADRPVIMGSVDGHSTWFSSGAFKAAGITNEIKDVEPGVHYFERDAETGELLGTAREAGGAMITDTLVRRDRALYRRKFLEWLPYAAQAGLTGVFDAGMGAPGEDDAYGLLRELETSGDLTLRIFASTAYRGPGDDPAARLLDLRQKYAGGELFRPIAVKLFADGVPEGHTAYLTNDYADRPGFRGLPMTAQDEMNRLVLSAQEKGVPAHIHAIGGAAVTLSLNAFEAAREKVGARDIRHGIGHMDLVEAEDIPRFRALGIIAQTSIQWAARDPSYANIGGFVGLDVMEQAYPVRTIIDAGVVQTFGADWPASAYLSTYKPFILIETAVTRQLPGRSDMPVRNEAERLTVAQAIAAMTRLSAYQMGEEASLGTLEIGKKADFIVLSADVFTISPYDIHKTVSTLTVVNGNVVYTEK